MVGNAWSFVRDPLGFLIQQHQTHGDLFDLDLGLLRFTVIADPELGTHVLKRSLSDFQKSSEHRRFIEGFMADGLVLSEPPLWTLQRKQLQPNFSHGRIEQYTSDFALIAEPYLETLDHTNSFEPFTFFSRINNRFTCQQILDGPVAEADLDRLKAGLGQLLNEFTKVLMLSKIPGPLGRFFVHRYEASLSRLRHFLKGLIMGSTVRPNFISAEARYSPDLDLTLQETATLFIASVETSATAATWALHCLSQHPEIQRACRDEIHHVLGNRWPQVEDFRALPAVYDVVRETLRLYPPLALLNRKPTREVELGGYTFGPEHEVSVALVLIQRHPDLWPDPHAFKPKRWSTLGPKPKGWMPFGAGPRNCIGSELGFIETAMFVTFVLQRFEVAPDPQTVGLAERPQFKMVLQPKDGFRLRLRSLG